MDRANARYFPAMTLPPAKSSHKFGPWTATALVVGNIIGVGVFMLPVSLAPYGWGSFLGWGLTLIGALCCLNGWVLLAGEIPAAMAGIFTFIVQLATATATALLLYVLAPLAALRFMANGLVPRSSGLSAAAVGAILFGAVAIFGSGGPAVAWGTGLVLAGWPLYRMVKRRVALAV